MPFLTDLKHTNGKDATWKQELQHNINSVDKLKEYIPLGEREEMMLREVAKKHPIKIQGTV